MTIGVALAICGGVYQCFPNLFRRGMWMKTSIAIRTMTPEAYVGYIKRLGWFYIVAVVVIFGAGIVGSFYMAHAVPKETLGNPLPRE